MIQKRHDEEKNMNHIDSMTKVGLNYMLCISTLGQTDYFQRIRKWNISHCGKWARIGNGICSQYTVLTFTPATHSLIGEQAAGVIIATVVNDQKQ